MIPGSVGTTDSMSLQAVLDIVGNQKVYQKRLDELKEVERSANKAVKELTKAKDLDKALKEAQAQVEHSLSLKEKAKAEYKSIISDAEAAAKKLMSDIETQASTYVDDAMKKHQEAEERLNNAKSLEEDAKKKHALIDRKYQDAEQAQADADQMYTHYQNKLDKIKSAMGDN